MKHDKPALTFEQQLDKLIARGLVVNDRQKALHYLSHINYYRFAGYLLPFEADHATHRLRPGTEFDQVLGLYGFDRELRLHVLDALERVEVSMRTRWAYHVAHGISPHGYLESAHAASAKRFARELALIEREVDRSRETFVAHNKSKYTSPDLPPAWVVCEVMSLGQLSRWYALLHPYALRKEIARPYGLDQQVLESVLHHLSYVRNVCAHHARLWNRECVVTWKVPHKGAATLLAAIADRQSNRIYNSLCLIAWLMDGISPGHRWRKRLRDLLDEHRPDLRAMGFPDGWQALELWREVER
jgi:abortive infection bacteriophage resistance protein